MSEYIVCQVTAVGHLSPADQLGRSPATAAVDKDLLMSDSTSGFKGRVTGSLINKSFLDSWLVLLDETGSVLSTNDWANDQDERARADDNVRRNVALALAVSYQKPRPRPSLCRSPPVFGSPLCALMNEKENGGIVLRSQQV